MLNVEKPYPPLLIRPSYPARPRAREALEVHIKELIELGVLTKVGNNEQVEVTTPVIIAWNNGKSRMVGDVRSENTYTIPDRYPIPRIHETLTQLSQAKFITAMDALKGFHQNVLTENAKKLLKIIVHCGIFEYLRMPFGVKNAPSYYQRMMNTIFPEELSEGLLIIYIDDIIVYSETWDSHLARLERVLKKIVQVNMKISLKKCHFAYSELKSLGHVVSGLSLGIDKNKVAAVLLKPMPQTNKEMQSFLGFSGYCRQHRKDFARISKTLINTILHECHDSVSAGHLSEYRTLERVKTCSWWPNWKKDVAYYCQTGDRCQQANRATGQEFGMMIQIQEPKSPWEIVHMDWVTESPPGGDRSYNACLVLIDGYSKTPISLPCHKDDTAMDTAIMICDKYISHTGLFQNIISDKDPKFTSALWTNLHSLFGTKLSFSTAYHPQTDGLAEIRIQKLEDTIRIFCSYGLEFKDSDGFTHY
ncbi:hypothetical protein O181_063755 [Austropuccinia psidii MF-1]|uniref:Integrase catalytic domain-containing protein n=1 Tax=Austropuccinia psidii MF-1 TaxID=1389203 RepID=A0A9Q3EJB8_9BASI|nr:hypothetical protein [Austropuccinia psidii MF-1]